VPREEIRLSETKFQIHPNKSHLVFVVLDTAKSEGSQGTEEECNTRGSSAGLGVLLVWDVSSGRIA
jgi:hypothetical protein